MHRLFASGAAVAALACSATTFATPAAAQTSTAAQTPAAAQFAPGSTLTFTGTADATDIGLGGVMLDFTPSRVVAAQSGNTGTFASLNRVHGTGVSGHIDDIRVGNGPQYDRNFLVLGGYRFTLLGLPSGSYGQDACYVDPAPGQTCTPFQSVQGDPTVNAGLSPFYVANAAAPNSDGSLNSTAAFNVFGTVTGPGNTSSTFTGTIASSFIGLPYQYVLYTLEQQGLPGLNFTGTFVVGAPAPVLTMASADLGAAVVPEPSTYALLAAGLVSMGAVAARRRARSSRGA